MALPVVFKYGTRAQYDALAEKVENALYFLTDTGEIYHGAVNLARGSHYEGIRGENETDEQIFARVLDGAPAVKDDIFVIKTAIAVDGEETRYSYTSFVYDGENWRAMDGNYNAKNVYFDADLTATAPIGVVTIPSSGSATIAAEGKNLDAVLKSILAERKNPTVSQPKVNTLKFTNSATSVEVGTEITPSYSATFDAGSYTYGPATGITVSSWNAVNTNGITAESTGATGTFPAITVADDTNYGMTITATHNAGAIPVDNLGDEVTDLQIAAGTKSKSVQTNIKGYRNYFYGAVDNTDAIDSALIRGLTKSNGAYAGAKTLNITCGDNAKRVIVAWPASVTRNGITEVLLTTSMNADITGEYKAIANVDVEGANGYTAVAYKVFVYAPASGCAGEKHQIKLA